MTFDPDDWRWTAYLLGELDEVDRAAIERQLAADPEARAYVDSLRDTVDMLARDLSAAPATPARLDDVARKRIERAAATAPRRGRRRWWMAGGAATMIAVAAMAMLRFNAGSTKTRGSAGPHAASGSATAQLADRSEGRYADRFAAGTRAQEKLERQLAQQPQGGSPAVGGRFDQKNRVGWSGDADSSGFDDLEVGLGDDGRSIGDNEAYSRIEDNAFIATATDARSTFSIDVDRASYANVRRFLEQGQRPPRDAVRIEELVNYFPYEHTEPASGQPFAITSEVGPSPWHDGYRLLKIGIQAPAIADEKVPPRNLVFLIDTSGSMQDANKLPLLQQSLALLVATLRPEDRISIVAYAGSAGLVLPPTSGTDRKTILAALEQLSAGGSTNGSAGIQLAYETAAKHARAGGVNRVILCTDGDYNVGVTGQGDLTRLIERERERGVFLTVLGFGQGNYKDSTMESLADRGNGNYGYIDSLREAQKLLVREGGGTLVTVAKDVKLQVEFNPATVAGYRLIGYENRALAHQDFNDDKKDAGEIGAGHAVTALYELVPAGLPVPTAGVDPLKYQTVQPTIAATTGELLTVNIRYKRPDSPESSLLSRAVDVASVQSSLATTSTDFRWATAVASFGMMLRDSPYRGAMTWGEIQALARGALGPDLAGDRREAMGLIDRAATLPAK